jgi:hypothetical protein
LASQARGFRYLNQTCIGKRILFFGMHFWRAFVGGVFREAFYGSLSDASFGCVSWRRFGGAFLDAFREAFSDGMGGFVGWLCELVWAVIIASIITRRCT